MFSATRYAPMKAWLLSTLWEDTVLKSFADRSLSVAAITQQRWRQTKLKACRMLVNARIAKYQFKISRKIFEYLKNYFEELFEDFRNHTQVNNTKYAFI